VSKPLAYCGRFAPSPTGPLHFGSLLAAVASYLEANRHAGRWLLRIENIDPPREQPAASERIVTALEAYGFEWHGPVIYQADSEAAHREALASLIQSGLAYGCSCSRRDLSDAPRTDLGTRYPGYCRERHLQSGPDIAIRIRTDDTPVCFVDQLQGPQQQRLGTETGDFVILRKDGLVAYHLAVVVDDNLQGVTHVVRGIDLMDSTPRQIWLQRCLGYESPVYAHFPVAVNADGSKLSKLTGAAAIPLDNVSSTLWSALTALRQEPPEQLATAPTNVIWDWAREHWDLDRLQHMRAIPGP
jgi:glutamyl-Q tRNA(Asp) synthetase